MIKVNARLPCVLDKAFKKEVRANMADYNALKEILGKTITGVIVKKNVNRSSPAMAVHLVFNDGTSYEIYADYPMNFAGGLNPWDMEKARKYGGPPMENVLDISVDEA